MARAFPTIERAAVSKRQSALPAELIDLLAAAGYHRVRLPSLPSFDKVLGGLVFCIMASSVTVETDLVFEAKASLGDKIRVSERAIRTLEQMRCPHPLQSHQIQGFDFDALLKVFRWATELAASTQDSRRSLNRERSSHYVQSVAASGAPLAAAVSSPSVPTPPAIRRSGIGYLSAVRFPRRVVSTVLAEFPSTVIADPGVPPAAAEDGHAPIQVDLKEFVPAVTKAIAAPVFASLVAPLAVVEQAAPSDAAASTAVAAAATRQARAQAEAAKRAEQATRRAEALEEELASVQISTEAMQQELALLERDTADLEERFQHDAVFIECLDVVQETRTFRTDAVDFMAACQHQAEQMDRLLERRKEVLATALARPVERTEEEKLFADVQQRIKGRERALDALRAAPDTALTAPELQQYVACFLHLYDTIGRLMAQHEALFSETNALSDRLRCVQSEQALAERVLHQWGTVRKQNPHKRGAFLDSLVLSAESVNKSVAGAKARLASVRERYANLESVHAQLVERQSQYASLVRRLEQAVDALAAEPSSVTALDAAADMPASTEAEDFPPSSSEEAQEAQEAQETEQETEQAPIAAEEAPMKTAAPSPEPVPPPVTPVAPAMTPEAPLSAVASHLDPGAPVLLEERIVKSTVSGDTETLFLELVFSDGTVKRRKRTRPLQT
jgi:hypothetical protein